ncbi:MAG: CRTAC1 family protein, partial [Pricia sp.]
GIDDTGYSVQGIFLDYDKDGDNDLYVLTNALVDYNRNTSRIKALKGQAPSTDRLYRNDGAKGFTNVTKEAGIMAEGFGLGVSICDLNNDNWPDIYVSNDFLTNDLLYINNQDGTFTDEIDTYIRHQSYNGMGNDIADINNDGYMDIMVVDMFPNDNKRIKQSMMKVSYDTYVRDLSLGYAPQMVRNTLQLNNGNGTFSEVGQLTGMHNTDWSWAPLMADFDNDGNKDVFISNGYRRDITNLDYIVYSKQSSYFGASESRDSINLKRLQDLPEVKLKNFVYKNNGDLSFENMADEWGLTQSTYSNGAAYADLDNDGDLELIVSNIDDKAFIYKNNCMELATLKNESKNYLDIQPMDNHAVGTKITVFVDGNAQVQTFSPIRGYLSTVTNRVHFGLGSKTQVDSILVEWPNEKIEVIKDAKPNQVLRVYQKNAIINKERPNEPNQFFKEISKDLNIEYRHQEDDFIELRYQASLLKMNTKLGPGIAVGDVNKDGLEDFYVGGTEQKNGQLFEQNKNGNFQSRSIMEEKREDMAVLLVDVDLDSDLDLISIDGGGIADMINKTYTDLIFINEGKGNFEPTELLQREGRGSCAEMADFDRDGDLDLFIGGKVMNGSY